METEIVKTDESPLATAAEEVPSAPELGSKYMLLKEIARTLSGSSIIPKEYQGKPHNCMIAIEMADRLGMPAMQVMNALHVINGRPSWSSQFLIATVNSCGRFTPLRFEFKSDQRGTPISCRASCTEKSTGEVLRGTEITLEMAKSEGWSTKAGSKWATMPELMLQYRAAAFWTRVHAPEIAMGLHTEEEARDIESKPRSLPLVLRKAEK